jgi:hypothetical protein
LLLAAAAYVSDLVGCMAGPFYAAMKEADA